jgi:hypothetical protein
VGNNLDVAFMWMRFDWRQLVRLGHHHGLPRATARLQRVATG